MTSFKINVKQLNDNCSDFKSQITSYKTAINNYYDNLKSIDSVWNDNNTEYYVNKNKDECSDIASFNEEVSSFINSISDFSSRIYSITSRCDVVNPNVLSYDGNNVLNAINDCVSANGSFGLAKYSLSHYSAPDSFKYKWQYNNLKYQLEDFSDRLDTIEEEIRSVYDDIESSINNLKEISSQTSFEDLEFDELDYKGYVVSVDSLYAPDDSDSNVVQYSASTTSANKKLETASSEHVDEIGGTFGHVIKTEYNDIHSDYEADDVNVISKGIERSQSDDINVDYNVTRKETGVLTDAYTGDKEKVKSETISALKNSNVSVEESVNDENVSSIFDSLKTTEQSFETSNTEVNVSNISEYGISNSQKDVVNKADISSAHISKQDVNSANTQFDKTTPSSSTTISSLDASSGQSEISKTAISVDNFSKLDSSDIFNG